MNGSRFSYIRVAVIPARMHSNFRADRSGADLHTTVEGGIFCRGIAEKHKNSYH